MELYILLLIQEVMWHVCDMQTMRHVMIMWQSDL